jgi:adenine-specific DNA glycosylase
LVPEGIRYDLHVNLVAHGRETCTPRDPKCGRCLIARYCSYYVKLSRLTLRPSARPGQRDLSSARPPVAVP